MDRKKQTLSFEPKANYNQLRLRPLLTSLLVLSKDPVLRYQVGTKKMKTSRYQVSLSTVGTKYQVDPVLAALSESCADALSS